MLEFSPGVEKTLVKTFEDMERNAAGALRREGFPRARQKHERSLALRYKGQSFELDIKQTGANLAASFHRAHRERYGYAQEANVVEIVSARVRSTGMVEKLSQRRASVSRKNYAKPAKFVTAYLDGKKLSVGVYSRSELSAGVQLRAPCIVTEYSSTTLIPSGARGEVDGHGNLIIQVT
jgi:N-methylhydantoinase A